VAAVIVALLGFKTTRPAPPPGVPRDADLLTVTGTPISQAVAPGFLGLSVELAALIDYAGSDPAHPNPVFTRLLRQLAPGGQPVLRIGGNSSDRSWFRTKGVKPGLGVAYSIPATWVPVARAVARASGARFILGLNLESRDPRLFTAELTHMSQIGSSHIAAFEVGNEPEKFAIRAWYVAHGHLVPGRPRSYDFSAYNREFSRFARLVPRRYALAGPAVGYLRWLPHLGPFLSAQPRVKYATLHLYPLANCVRHPSGAQAPTIAHVTSPAASTAATAPLAAAVRAAHAHHAALRLDELNSVACGGAAGVSDRLASALWVLDTLFALAREGVDGVNIHTFAQAQYRTFRFSRTHGSWSGAVSPLYYGLLAFARLTPPGSRLLQTSQPTDPDLRMWATSSPGGHLHVVLINDSAKAPRTVAIKLPPSATGAPLTLERLSAPGGLTAASGITLGGQGFGASTTTGRLAGRLRTGRVRQIRRGIYLLTLPPAGATLLSR
jgi:hypothetical protein